MKFTGTAYNLKRFLQRASLAYTIKHLAVDMSKDKLFTSATPEDADDTWVMCATSNFRTSGKSETIVLNMDDARTVLKNIPDDKEITCEVKNNTLKISAKGSKLKAEIDLGPLDSHVDPENSSSYIQLNDDGQRLQNEIIKNEDRGILPVYKDMMSFLTDGTVFQKKIKAAFGTKIQLFIKDGILCFGVSTDSIRYADEICQAWDMEWNEHFSESIRTVISLFEKGDVTVAMTEAVMDDDNNWGIWFSQNVDGISSCYWVAPEVEL